jgi:cell wall-associated NlpC family hydrolase
VVGLVAAQAPASAEPGDPKTQAELRQRITTSTHQLEVVVERYNLLRDDLRTTVAQIGVLKRQFAPLQAKIGAHQERIGVIASAAYMASGTAPVNALLRADSAHTVINNLLVLDSLARDQHSEIASLVYLRQQYESAQQTLGTLIETGREQQKQLSADRARIEGDIAQLQRWRNLAVATGAATVTRKGDLRIGWTKPEVTGASAKVLDVALAQLGKGYRFAAEGPNNFDCSGLVTAAFKLVGVDLPHHSGRQYEKVKKIKRSQLRVGDLVFYYRDLHHVAIYIGGNRMIHAPSEGENVRVDLVDYQPVAGFGRVPTPASPPGKK